MVFPPRLVLGCSVGDNDEHDHFLTRCTWSATEQSGAAATMHSAHGNQLLISIARLHGKGSGGDNNKPGYHFNHGLPRATRECGVMQTFIGHPIFGMKKLASHRIWDGRQDGSSCPGGYHIHFGFSFLAPQRRLAWWTGARWESSSQWSHPASHREWLT
jgi:hypothetical protein